MTAFADWQAREMRGGCILIAFGVVDGEGLVRKMEWATPRAWRKIGELLAVGSIAAILAAGLRSVPVAAVAVPYPHDLAR